MLNGNKWSKLQSKQREIASCQSESGERQMNCILNETLSSIRRSRRPTTFSTFKLIRLSNVWVSRRHVCALHFAKFIINREQNADNATFAATDYSEREKTSSNICNYLSANCRCCAMLQWLTRTSHQPAVCHIDAV